MSTARFTKRGRGRNIAAQSWVLCVGLVGTSAMAGFIDERKAAAPTPVASAPAPSAPAAPSTPPLAAAPPAPAVAAPVAQAAGTLVGFGPGWNRPLEFGATNMTLPGALMRMKPPGEELRIFAPTAGALTAGAAAANPLTIELSWTQGETPLQVLARAAQTHGLSFQLAQGSLTVTRGEVAGPALKKFEVRLNDIRLNVAMQRWASDSGVRLRWDADRHLLISAPMVFEANDVLQAIGMALSTPGLSQSAYPLEVCEYPNVPPLLRITRQGEQAKDCPN